MSSENFTFFEQVILVLIGALATGIVAVAIGAFKHRNDNVNNLRNDISQNRERIRQLERCQLLLRKAIILKAQMTDEQIKHDHPSEFHEYEKVIKEILDTPESINNL